MKSYFKVQLMNLIIINNNNNKPKIIYLVLSKYFLHVID